MISDATPAALAAALGTAGTAQDFQGTGVWAGPRMRPPPGQTLQDWWREKFGECSSNFAAQTPDVIAHITSLAPGNHMTPIQFWMFTTADHWRWDRPFNVRDEIGGNGWAGNGTPSWVEVPGGLALTMATGADVPSFPYIGICSCPLYPTADPPHFDFMRWRFASRQPAAGVSQTWFIPLDGTPAPGLSANVIIWFWTLDVQYQQQCLNTVKGFFHFEF